MATVVQPIDNTATSPELKQENENPIPPSTQPNSNDHINSNSSLLDLDYVPQKNKHQKSTSDNNKSRKSSLSTESVEVYIYRRTSLVTSSGGSLMQLNDDHTTSKPSHQRMETGMNLWDAPNKKIHNYQLQELSPSPDNDETQNEPHQDQPENDHELDENVNNGYHETTLFMTHDDDHEINMEQYDNELQEEQDTITPITMSMDIDNTKDNIEILPPAYDQNKSRDSLSVDEQIQTQAQTQMIHQPSNETVGSTEFDDMATVITRKSTAKTLVYHPSADESVDDNEYSEDEALDNDHVHHNMNSEDDEKLIKEYLPTKSGNDNMEISGYLIMKESNHVNGKGRDKTMRMEINTINTNPKTNTNASKATNTLLEMIGSPIVTPMDNINHIKPSIHMTTTQNDSDEKFFIEYQARNSERLSQIQTRHNDKHVTKQSIEDEFDFSNQKPRNLTRENLMVHDYKHNLDDIKDDLDEIQETKSIRYIAISEDDQQHPKTKYQHGNMTHFEEDHLKSTAKYHMDLNESDKQKKKEKNKILSRRAKYVTMIGAVCCVTVLIGYVMYTRNGGRNTRMYGRNGGSSTNALMVPPRARRRPPILK